MVLSVCLIRIQSDEVLEEFHENPSDPGVIENTVYLGVDWECPKYNDALFKPEYLVSTDYWVTKKLSSAKLKLFDTPLQALSAVLADDGQITRAELRSDVLPRVQTGLLQSIIYSSKGYFLLFLIAEFILDNKLHISVARPAKNYSNIEAYNQVTVDANRRD